MKFEPLNVSVDLINDKVCFTGTAGTNTPVSIDYTPPVGDGQGYTSLELFLLSLSSCMGTSMLLMLRKQQLKITGCRIMAQGTRREEHPTCFDHITVYMEFHSPDATDTHVEQALRITESTLCPVWAIIKGNVEVHPTWKIITTTA